MFKPNEPDTLPARVKVPFDTFTKESWLKVSPPLKVLLPPALNCNVPPLSVTGSVPVPHCKSNTPPEFTVVPPALEPRLEALVATKVPPETVVAPV